MAAQMADHRVPNQIRGFLISGRKREGGEVFRFQRLAEAFIGAGSKKLKMRHLPSTT
jgi:hypothetical protein